VKRLVVKGAREHNLKDIDLELPRNSFIVVTGVSGSGKSSLAFDTLYAEGQRRYVESLSSYARQFLGQMKKPDVDSITGIPPAVAIQQKGPGYNPRSTVGTLTEIYDYLRLLFARVGVPHCPKCGRMIKSQSVDEIVKKILEYYENKKIQIMAPLVRGRKGAYRELFDRLRGEGFISVEIDGKPYSLEEKIELDKNRKHDIKIVVDRLTPAGSSSGIERITDSIELALKESGGTAEVKSKDSAEVFSKHYACALCGISVEEIEPRNFSFNSPFGACEECSGLGVKLVVDEDLVVPDKNLSINQGALKPWSAPITTRRRRWQASARRYAMQMVATLASEMGFSLDTPFKSLKKKARRALLYGSDKEYEFVLQKGGRVYRKSQRFEGVISQLTRRHLQTDSSYVRDKIQNEYMREMDCPSCGGSRLKKEVLSVTVGGKNIAELTAMPVNSLKESIEKVKKGFSDFEMKIAGKILSELTSRLGFLIDVGVDYVSLDRKASTLSSGESERIRLATQIGSSLVGVIYILDEPTVGLHARDTARLLRSLKRLQELGNTVVVVEHDPVTIQEADYIVDLGPGAGLNGGEVVYSGSRDKFSEAKNSITADYFTGGKNIPMPDKTREPGGKKISLKGCSQHNLKKIDVDFPLGLLICVTGVSGSGKSTLVEEILYKALKKEKNPSASFYPGSYKKIEGADNIKNIINIDQTPIGKTPRSNPATYTKVLTPIRELFARLPESRARGYSKGRFSFNVKKGTCAKCKGQGEIKLEMHFLPDIYVPCESCGGKKYTDATLQIKYRGKNIHDVMEMTVDEALDFFSRIPSVKSTLQTLADVGLGYVKLGQPSTTLSGGEAQRIKLARELSKKSSGETLYILDEPTTGLHSDDVKYLLSVLHSLVDRGNTVVVIEHNMDVIKNADLIIDMGPEGGSSGGRVVVCAKPLNLIKYQRSYTGKFLKKYLRGKR